MGNGDSKPAAGVPFAVADQGLTRDEKRSLHQSFLALASPRTRYLDKFSFMERVLAGWPSYLKNVS